MPSLKLLISLSSLLTLCAANIPPFLNIKLSEKDPRLAEFKAARGKGNGGSDVLARGLLDQRQLTCPVGYGYCSASGKCCSDVDLCCSYGYCIATGDTCCPTGPCDPGENCCGQSHCYPEGGECCSNEGYCVEGNHCYLLYGRNVCCTDKQCTAKIVDGTTSFIGTTTQSPEYTYSYSYSYSYRYYYFTFSFYYYSFYLTAGEQTSTTVYTTTTLSYYASDSAEASSVSASVESDLSSYQSEVNSEVDSYTIPDYTGGAFSYTGGLFSGGGGGNPTFAFSQPSGLPSFPTTTPTGTLQAGGGDTPPDAASTYRVGSAHWVAIGVMMAFAGLSGTLMVLL